MSFLVRNPMLALLTLTVDVCLSVYGKTRYAFDRARVNNSKMMFFAVLHMPFLTGHGIQYFSDGLMYTSDFASVGEKE